MPRVEFELWDRLYLLKLVSITQMTFSSFVALIYCYLITLQSWLSSENNRSDIMNFKWSVIVVSILDFGNGTLLAFASNQRRIYCVRGTVAWIILETLLIPIGILLLIQLNNKLAYSKQKFVTDVHYSRANTILILVQVCFFLCQYFFIGYALDFLVYKKQKAKKYDPNIRPETVDAPTDPQITTTESRHIRLSQSFLFQPSTSKRVTMYDKDGEAGTNANTNEQNEVVTEWRDEKEWRKDREWDEENVERIDEESDKAENKQKKQKQER